MEQSDLSDLSPSGSITMLYQQWRDGRSEALGELISRFWPRLMALANSTLSGRIEHVSDAEDALQSAMISFGEQVGEGGFRPEMDRDDLWNVLGLITVRKALKLQEKERTQKRGGGRVVSGLDLDHSPLQSLMPSSTSSARNCWNPTCAPSRCCDCSATKIAKSPRNYVARSARSNASCN